MEKLEKEKKLYNFFKEVTTHIDKSTYEVRLAQWTGLVKSASERPRGVLLKDWLDDKRYFP